MFRPVLIEFKEIPPIYIGGMGERQKQESETCYRCQIKSDFLSFSLSSSPLFRSRVSESTSAKEEKIISSEGKLN